MSKSKAQRPRRKKKSRATTKTPLATADDTSGLLQRVQRDPASISTQEILALHNTIGNQAVQRLMMARETSTIQRQPAQEKSSLDTQLISIQADSIQRNILQRVNFLHLRKMKSQYKGENKSLFGGDTVDYYQKGSDRRENARVTVNNGQLVRAGGDREGSPVDTSRSSTFWSRDGWEIFVMSSTGEIYMMNHEMGKKLHSSLLAGGDVAAAGEIRVSNGTIRELNCKSGHYRPTEIHIQQILHFLQKNGNDLNFMLDLTQLDTYDEKIRASVYWERLGQDSYEGQKTLQAWKQSVNKVKNKNIFTMIVGIFSKVPAENAVKATFTQAKWKIVQTPTDDHPAGNFTKPDGEAASPKEIRAFLKQHFMTDKRGRRKQFGAKKTRAT